MDNLKDKQKILNMPIIFFGYNNWGALVIDFLLSNKYNVPLIIVNDTNEQKLNKIFNILKKHHYKPEILVINKENRSKVISRIKELNPIAGISCSYGGIIIEEIFSIPEIGILNIHGGPLPQMRGCNEINWAIIEGRTKSAVTIHLIDKTLDTGPIFCSKIYSIKFEDTINDVKNRMFKATVELLEEDLSDILTKKIRPNTQDHKLAKYYPKRRREDGKINWNKNAIDIYNLIRALTSPFPGAFSYLNGKKIVFNSAYVIFNNKPYKDVGKIIKVAKERIVVTTGYNLLVVTGIKNTDEYKENEFKEKSKFE